jgi:Tfp pilus assembly protein PilF
VRLVAGLAGLVVLILAPNLLGEALNAWFLDHPGVDKVLHVLAFTAFFMIAAWLLRGVVEPVSRRFAAAWLIGLCLGLGDEFVQSFTTFRSVEALDLVADAAGLTVGWVLSSPFQMLLLAPAALAVAAAGYASYDTYTRLIDYSTALRYARTGDFVSAREHLHRALDHGMRSAAFFNEMSWVEIESGVGDPVHAVEWARSALDVQPANPDILDTYGWALHHAGRTDDARRALERAFELNPDIYCIHYHLGVVYGALGQRDRAVTHFREQLTRAETREAGFARTALLEMGADPEPR